MQDTGMTRRQRVSDFEDDDGEETTNGWERSGPEEIRFAPFVPATDGANLAG
jgi:hypothetical protein